MSKRTVFLVAIVALLWAMFSLPAAAQSTDGQVAGAVTDSSGLPVIDAKLELRDTATRMLRTQVSRGEGTFLFPTIPPGIYELTVSTAGFQTFLQTGITVYAARTTDVNVTLKVGAVAQQVDVTASAAAAPMLEATSTILAMTVDTKELQDLPLDGRDVFQFAYLAPGYQRGTSALNMTFNNLQGAALNFTVEGVNNNYQQWKSAGTDFATYPVVGRLEAIQEVTVSTSLLDSTAGGQGGMQVQFVSRRGSNQLHGMLFEQHRNAFLNANKWSNNAVGLARAALILNDFGGSVGGPFFKNKLFFFLSVSESIQPLTTDTSATILTPAAQSGLFTYTGTDGVVRSVNLLQAAGAAGYQSTVNPTIAAGFKQINDALGYGKVSTIDLIRNQLQWRASMRNKNYYPAARLDYSVNDRVRLYSTWNMTRNLYKGRYPSTFPGPAFDRWVTGSRTSNYIATIGGNVNLRPSLTNDFKAGFQQAMNSFSPEATPDVFHDLQINFPLSLTSPYKPPTSQSRNSPVVSLSDNGYYQRGSHAITFGVNMMDSVTWNHSPVGIMTETLAYNSSDPVNNALVAALPAIPSSQLTNAQNLYASLTGRVNSLSQLVNLDRESLKYQMAAQGVFFQHVRNWGLFGQDIWRIRPTLNFNYGVRWDMFGSFNEKSGIYAAPDLTDLWGPSGVGNLFQPGRLPGEMNPKIRQQTKLYEANRFTPSPHFGLAWTPVAKGGIFRRLLGDKKTVLRAGYSMNYYTEGGQLFWQIAHGPFLSQNNQAAAVTDYPAGSLFVGQPFPALRATPSCFCLPINLSDYAFRGTTFYSAQPKMTYPYVESWSFGLQRELARNTVLEVRYVGNNSLHGWAGVDENEINIFENGFLNDFNNAQKNLALNQAAGVSSFANRNLAGQVPLPIFEAAFGARGSQAAMSSSSAFGSGTFISYLNSGQAGRLANSLGTASNTFCRMVGNTFGPCAALGFDAPGPYPLNFFQVNPYIGRAYMENDEATANYNALQVNLRMRGFHGLTTNLNYTWAHSLMNSASRNYAATRNYITLRNKRLNYGPAQFDVRHAFAANAVYDLPFGYRRKFLSGNSLVSHLVGGWTLGVITHVQSGTPFPLSGGNWTMNNNPSGIVLNGTSVAQVRSMVGIYHAGSPWTYLIDPKVIASDGTANSSSFTAVAAGGQIGQFPVLYAPRTVTADLAMTKRIYFKERYRISLQLEALNALNHPSFVSSGSSEFSTTSTTFGQTTATFANPRNLQLRMQVEF